MTTLTLVRHGQTDWNRDGLIQGATDIALNETGRVQARDAARALQAQLTGERPIVVVSSDLSRARETAQIIADVFAVDAPRAYPLLRERSYGEGEGVSVDEIRRRYGSWDNADIPGAEPWPAVRRRAIRALRTIVRDVRHVTAPVDTSIIAVSHGALIRELIRHATGGDLPRPGERLANGSTYTVLLERERIRLLSYSGG